MKQIKLEPEKKALVIVAHPDDETIWMGGTILKFTNIDWTIFCLTRSSDKDREPKFKRICEIFGARAIMTDLEDEGKLDLAGSVPKIKKYLKDNIKKETFDYVFTHGSNGEYGHTRHKGVHKAVIEMARAEELIGGTFFCFNYKKAGQDDRPSMIAKSDSDVYLSLEQKMFMRKKRLQADIHGYEWNGVDNSLCTNPEAFKIFRF